MDTRQHLEAVRGAGQTLQFQVLATIDSLPALGALHAGPAVEAALAKCMR